MIQFDSKKSFYKTPFGAVENGTELRFRIKITDGRTASFVHLIIHSDNGDTIQTIEGIRETILDNGDTVYRFSTVIREAGLYFYFFEACCPVADVEAEGEVTSKNEQTHVFQLTVYSESYKTPEWLKSGLMYQIFPDRFAKSSSYHPPEQTKNLILRQDWGGEPNGSPDENGIIQNNDFFGGNLKGIMEQLDYLEDLGVTVIYLNPVFEAYSNHRYDTADYKKIDPLLGMEEDFIELCKKAKERGIRIVLDGVFNHTGSDSLYFNKKGRYPEIGAYQSVDSRYYPWYRFFEYPEKYDSWWGIDTLPQVNETNSSYLDYIIRSEDSVIKHWLRCGASGYRLDVADELPDEFLEALRTAVKAETTDGAVIGEVWEDASNKISYGQRRKYFLGSQLDSVMNYPLKNAIINFLVKDMDGCKLERVINNLCENYPKPAFSALMNILGTHDTPRILTVLSENSKDEGHTRQRLFLAMLITAFMPGIPCIYYGDEFGMRGGRDPENRRCYEPDRGDALIYKFYRRLFSFRKRIDGLNDYTLVPRSAEGSLYSFCRSGNGGRLIIAVNAGNQDYLLNLAMKAKEILKDYFISGNVLYERHGVFRIKENSGIVVYIKSL